MRRLAFIVLAAVLVIGAPAWAFWGSSGTGGGAAGSSDLTAAVLSVPSTSTGSTVVSFTEAYLAANPVAGPIRYVVQRRLNGGAWAAVASGPCSGTLTKPVTSCTDTVTQPGAFDYRATATYASWTATSNTVGTTVSDTAPKVNSIVLAATSPTNTASVSWTVTFNKSVTGVDASDFTVIPSGLSGTPAVTSVTGTGATRTVTASTGSGDGTLSLSFVDDDTVVDQLGQPPTGNGGYAGPAYTLDRTTPALTTLKMYDTNFNGKVDRVVATFNEALATSTLKTNWTLASVPSTGTLNTVATSGTTATLTLTEGGGAANTAVGAFTVALAANAAGIKDAAGNQASFTARAPDDAAGPALLLGGAENNGATDGLPESGDWIQMQFSEPLLASTVPTTGTITYSRTGAANVFIVVSGTISSSNLGTPTYLSGPGTAVFASSYTLSGANITNTVGACQSGCALPTAPSTVPTATFLPATTLTDAAGNVATGTQTVPLKIF